MPVNNEILKITNDASNPDSEGPDPELVDKLLGEWRKHAFVRLSIAAVAWGLGTTSLLLA